MVEHVYGFAYMHIHIYMFGNLIACVHKCMCLSVYVSVLYACVCIYAPMCVTMCANPYACAYMCVYMCMC